MFHPHNTTSNAHQVQKNMRDIAIRRMLKERQKYKIFLFLIYERKTSSGLYVTNILSLILL